MTRRQTTPKQWLILDNRIDPEHWQTLRKLPRGSGVLVLRSLDAVDNRSLRSLSRARHLTIVVETPRSARRVHSSRELTRALLKRTPLILLSPLWPTRSHPDWRPLPRMRAATLARLAGRRAVALGGMNAVRYAKIAALGFGGWAGISAWSRPKVIKFTE